MSPRKRANCLLVVSEDEALHRRVVEELALIPCEVHKHTPQEVGAPGFWKDQPCFPGAILLDVQEDFDTGDAILRSLKRARVSSGLIVLTPAFSHEFGTKIVSHGISYCLARDFDSNELCQVVSSLVWPRETKNPTEGSSSQPRQQSRSTGR